MTGIHHDAAFWKAEREWSERLARWQAKPKVKRTRPARDPALPGELDRGRTPTPD